MKNQPERTSSLVAHWSFDVPVGATLPDGTGRFSGKAEGVRPSEDGGAWYFPGDTAHVRVTHEPTLDLVDGFTIEATVRLARLGNPRNGDGIQAILEKHIGKGGWLLVVLRDGRLGYWMETPTGRAVDSSDVALVPGRWYHVALTWDLRTTVFWLDGVSAGEKPFTGPLGRCPQDLYLGNDDTKNWSWMGDIADIRISNEALSPEHFHRAR